VPPKRVEPTLRELPGDEDPGHSAAYVALRVRPSRFATTSLNDVRSGGPPKGARRDDDAARPRSVGAS
jgi:hypothetical protein